jgi:hypothetical protein
MGNDTSVAVRYWISTDHPSDYPDLEGIGDFRDELDRDYVSLVRGRASGAGGGAYLLVEIISKLPWSHIVQLLIDGAVYDLIKEGSRSFVLRPFIQSYKKLRDRNQNRRFYLSELRIEFQDCLLVIHEVSINTIVDNLWKILPTVAEHFNRLTLDSGERPVEIHVPVVEDPDEDRPCRFRVLAHVDETITGKGPDDYFGHWGLVYDRASTVKVYDIVQGLLLDERFNTVEEYWRDLSRKAKARMKS